MWSYKHHGDCLNKSTDSTFQIEYSNFYLSNEKIICQINEWAHEDRKDDMEERGGSFLAARNQS